MSKGKRSVNRQRLLISLDADIAARVRKDAATRNLSYSSWLRRVVLDYYTRTDDEHIERERVKRGAIAE